MKLVLVKHKFSLVRSLLSNPSLLLLDEPFSNVDIGLKEKLQVNLKNLLKENKISTVIVTHIIMRKHFISVENVVFFLKNKLIQFDNPYNIYHFSSFTRSSKLFQ